MVIIAQLVPKTTSIIHVHSAHIFLQGDCQIPPNAEVVPKAHSARTTKWYFPRNVQWAVIAMSKVQNNQIINTQHLASFANNACLEVNAPLKAQFILKDALQVLTVQMVQINASLVLKDSIAARSIQLLFLQ